MTQAALPLTSHVWLPTRDGDPSAFAIFRRHYTFQPKRKQFQFVGPGESLVLLTHRADALFIWRKERYRLDDQTGVNCSVFRNESQFQSSDLIRAAVDLAWQRWPSERLFTFVNPRRIRSTNPGYCFQMAGWTLMRDEEGDLLLTKTHKYAVLEIQPCSN